MSASSSSSSSFTPPHRKYDVFLSFRGEDTRDNFTDHLYDALKRANIRTFIDYSLDRGEEITPALLKAIEECKISVIIFSENYAHSRCCLDELVKILECKNTNGQIVIPVFYRVDPSDVRHQTRSFADAFAKHGERMLGNVVHTWRDVMRKALDLSWWASLLISIMAFISGALLFHRASPSHYRKRQEDELSSDKIDKLQTWRSSLKEAANISGFHLLAEGRESKLVKEIIADILKKLNRMSQMNLPLGLIGIESRIKEMKFLLDLEKPNVRVVGIWGMGGIGKTTLAKAVCMDICTQFEAFCFIEDAGKEVAEHLCEKVVLQLLYEESQRMSSFELKSAFVRNQLRAKKVFIVLDNLNSVLKLQNLQESLGGDLDLLGPGSRVLVTSRDRQVLKVIADVVHEVKGLDMNEAPELFRLKAFKMTCPSSHYIELSRKVLNYANGNPLALTVLGSALYGKTTREWESALEDLKEVAGIQDVLRISYDGLQDREKEIFLDIACFFRGWDQDHVTEILNGFYPSVHFKINNLIDRCLLTISNKKLEMHDLLQEMGWNIEKSKDLGNRSRFWNHKEIHYILSRKKGTDAIVGLFLNMSEGKEMNLDSDAFAGMDRLRLLNFYGYKNKVHLPPAGLQSISNELRYFFWAGFPSKSLPLSFCADNLVELKLTGSNLEQLWSGEQDLVNLRLIDLSGSHSLTTLPDLSKAQNIIDIRLGGCRSLLKLPFSIQYLEKLETLDLQYCENLETLPPRLDSLSLRKFYLRGCSKVKTCPHISGNIEELSLDESGIEEITPHSVDKLKNLSELDLFGCSNLIRFPEITSSFLNMERLYLSRTAIKEIPSSIEFLTRLKGLNMSDCKELLTIPASICKLKSLVFIDLRGCSKLESFPEILEPMESLKELDLKDCKSLKRIPNSSFQNMKFLERLYLSGTTIEELPSSIRLLGCLEVLEMEGCKSVFSAPGSIRMSNLTHLNMRSCNLAEIPSAILTSSLFSLKTLELGRNNFKSLPATIKQLPCLEVLKLDNCKCLSCLPELPEALYLLDLSGTNLRSFPQNFDKLSMLGHLLLANCKHLGRLVLQQLPCSVGYVGSNDGGRVSPNETSSCRYLKKENLISWLKLDQQARRQIIPFQLAYWGEPLSVLFPGSEVPEWFDNRGAQSSVKIWLPSSTYCSRGIAFCAVFDLDPVSGNDELIKGLAFRCKCLVKADGSEQHGYHELRSWRCEVWPSNSSLIESEHVLMWYDFRVEMYGNKWLTANHDREALFEFYASERYFNKPLRHCKVKKCGVILA